MNNIGRHLIIDGIYNKSTHDLIHKDRSALAQYLENVTKITGMTLVFPPIAMQFPFAGETNKLIELLDKEGMCEHSAIFQNFREHVRMRNNGGSGVSAIAVWVESHCTVHSWPERNYISIDLFSCSTYDIEPVIDYTIEALGLVKASFVCVDRKMNGDLPEVTTFDIPTYTTGKLMKEAQLLRQFV